MKLGCVELRMNSGIGVEARNVGEETVSGYGYELMLQGWFVDSFLEARLFVLLGKLYRIPILRKQ
jgi:hypothetical protein